MNGDLFLVGLISTILGFVVLLLGGGGRGGFEHGDTKITGPLELILIVFGVLLMAIASGLP